MKNRKRISVLLVLAMVMTMLAGLAAPAAATTPVTGVVIGHVPTVVSAIYSTLASIRFSESGASIGNIQDGDQITVTLPSGVTFDTTTSTAVYNVPASMNVTSARFGPSNNLGVGQPGDNSVTLTLDRIASVFDPAAFTVVLPVRITTVGSGPINVTVTTNTTAISGGTFAVGTFGTAAVTVDSTGTIRTVSRFVGSAQQGGITIRFRENAPGAFHTGALNRVVLTLPEGATWGTTPSLTGIAASVDAANPRRLFVTRETATSVATTFTIPDHPIVVNRLAALGDLTVTVAGEGTNAGITGSVVIARVADFDITVRRLPAVTTPEVFNAGRTNPVALTDIIELVETTPGSLIAGGTITLTLPAGFRWNTWNTSTGPAAAIVSGTGTNLGVSNGTRVSDSVYRFTVNTASTTAGTVRVTLPANAILASLTAAAGDLVVAVGGTAGAAGNVAVATVRSAVTVAASAAPRLRVGITAQDAGNIVITEAAANRLVAGQNITLTLPANVTFSSNPTVTRTSGNITLGDATVSGNNVLTIPVTAASTVASVITVSGIKYNVDRLVPDGDITVTAGGDALVNSGVAAAFPTRVANARIGGVMSSVFTIGALSFVRDGVTTAIDLAPTIVDGRTLLPLRFAALAVGVSEDDIIWDGARRTVTLFRGDRVVQLRIGDRHMTINGVVIPLEVPAAISNGRTVLPIRAVGTALRAGIEWDATARTVTVTAQ